MIKTKYPSKQLSHDWGLGCLSLSLSLGYPFAVPYFGGTTINSRNEHPRRGFQAELCRTHLFRCQVQVSFETLYLPVEPSHLSKQ